MKDPLIPLLISLFLLYFHTILSVVSLFLLRFILKLYSLLLTLGSCISHLPSLFPPNSPYSHPFPKIYLQIHSLLFIFLLPIVYLLKSLIHLLMILYFIHLNSFFILYFYIIIILIIINIIISYYYTHFYYIHNLLNNYLK
jgi:hypothetical protein